MSLAFDHEILAQRVLFGTGTAAARLTSEVARLGASRVMVIASKAESELATSTASGIDVVLWHHDVVMHVPAATAEKARAAALEYAIDLVVCIGGGSTTGLAKAVALTTGLPIIAVPTTYAGSEATNVWGLTEESRKTTGMDPKVLPVAVIYDPALTLSLPGAVSIASGLNGLAHCIDSLWAPRADPINAALAAEGIRALGQGLPLIAQDSQDLEGREQALYGAYLAAAAFASAGSGLHHKICHVLGGTFNLPHAQTHAAVLPYVLAFNAPQALGASARIAAAFGVSGTGAEDALAGLQHLRSHLDAPKSLAEYGFRADGIGHAVQIILPTVPASNPRPVTAENLTALLEAALTGDSPESLLTM